MIDSHAHLSMVDPAELGEVLARAGQAGVTKVLVPATSPTDLDEVLSLAADYAGSVVVAVGIHPHEARHLDAGLRQRLERAVGLPGVVAVGEIGLDFHYDLSPREDQRRAFEWQLALAQERGLPVVLHQREAWSDFVAALDRAPGLSGVAHSFTEGTSGAVAVIERGLYVGISGMVTFPRADNVRAAALAVPPGRLLVETDSPYLAPVPHRGKTNEPAFVCLVAAAVARLREVELAQLERETDEAFEMLFASRQLQPGS
jgi:TatD DNase family protein